MRSSLPSILPSQQKRLYTGVVLIFSTLCALPVAQAASCKLPKSYYKYVSCTADSRYFLAVKDYGAPVALIDKNGKRVVDLSRYQSVDADRMANGLMPVQRYDRVGYINLKGQEVIPIMYDRLREEGGKHWARPVSEGRIVVKKDGEFGIIDTANRVVAAFSSSVGTIDDFHDGVARVRKGKTTEWVDKNGQVSHDPNSQPNSGSNAVSKPKTVSKSVPNSVPKTRASSQAQKSPNASRFTTLQAHQQNGKWGFVDDHNVTMITYSFDDVRPFSEGLAGVRVNGQWGFVNLGGELVIPFQFKDRLSKTGDNSKGGAAFIFQQGKAWVGNFEDGRKHCIDTQGRTVSCE